MPKFYPIAAIRIQAQVALTAAGNDAQREHALATTLIGWTSQRDCLLMALMYNTGARVSEVIGVKVVTAELQGSRCVGAR